MRFKSAYLFLVFSFSHFLIFSFFASAQVLTRDELLAPVETDGKWGYINPMGEMVIPPDFEGAGNFSERRANVKYGTHWGYIWKNDEWALKPVFLEAYSFRDHRALINVMDPQEGIAHSGYITYHGDFDIILQEGETGYDFHEGFAKVRSFDVNGLAFGFKDSMGNWAVKPHYDAASDFNEHKAAVMLGDKWGFINTRGDLVIFPIYKEAYPFNEELAYVDFNTWKAFIKPNGKKAFKVMGVEDVDNTFSEGMVAFRKGGKMGFMDKKGHVAIKARFDNVNFSRFHEELAQAETLSNNVRLVGYINPKGEWVIPAQFEEARNFSNGYAFVKKDGKYGVIDKSGKWLCQPKYNAAGDFMPTYR